MIRIKLESSAFHMWQKKIKHRLKLIKRTTCHLHTTQLHLHGASSLFGIQTETEIEMLIAQKAAKAPLLLVTVGNRLIRIK